VVVSWPVSASCYILESTSSLFASQLDRVQQGATLSGSRYNLTLTARLGRSTSG